jgi:hypothetical protein
MSGVSTFDLLGDMPSAQRTLMRLFLRRIQMNEAELESAVAELPEEKRLAKEQIQEALMPLLNQGWVKKLERNDETIYTVQQQPTKK